MQPRRPMIPRRLDSEQSRQPLMLIQTQLKHKRIPLLKILQTIKPPELHLQPASLLLWLTETPRLHSLRLLKSKEKKKLTTRSRRQEMPHSPILRDSSWIKKVKSKDLEVMSNIGRVRN